MDLVLEAYEEHHVLKFLLAEISEADPEAENFDARLTVLEEIVEHHVEEEEAETFPSAEKKLGQERLEELAAEMQAAAGKSSTPRRVKSDAKGRKQRAA